MKIAKTIIVLCGILLIILAESTRYSILHRLETGIPVPEYELKMSRFLDVLSFAPVGLGIGFVTLLFPRYVIATTDKWIGEVRANYPPSEVIRLRLIGVLFIGFTLVALWSKG
jgi:hypothetical protein